jgi:hypothetical protein
LIKCGWITICPLAYDNVNIHAFLYHPPRKKREKTVPKVTDKNNPNMNIKPLQISTI